MRLHRATIALILAGSTAGAQAVRIGGPAPEIDLPTLSGGRVQLSKLHGHPVVVSFWGTWCPPCRTEFPELVKAQRSYGGSGLIVLGVNGRDQEFSTKDVEKFAAEFSVPFQIALDQRGRSRSAFQIFGLPTTVFIDSAGVVKGIHRGPIDREQLDSAIATIVPHSGDPSPF